MERIRKVLALLDGALGHDSISIKQIAEAKTLLRIYVSQPKDFMLTIHASDGKDSWHYETTDDEPEQTVKYLERCMHARNLDKTGFAMTKDELFAYLRTES